MVKQAMGKAPSMVGCWLRGMAAAAAATLLGAMAVAKLVDSEVISRDYVGYGSMAVLLVASWLSAVMGKNRAGHMAVRNGIGIGMGYFGALVAANFLFFGGSFRGMGVTLLVILLGTGLALMPLGQGRGVTRKRRYKIPK